MLSTTGFSHSCTIMMAQKSNNELLNDIKNEVGHVKAELKEMKKMMADLKQIASTPVKAPPTKPPPAKALTPHDQAKANGLFVDNIEEKTGVSQQPVYQE